MLGDGLPAFKWNIITYSCLDIYICNTYELARVKYLRRKLEHKFLSFILTVDYMAS